MSQTRRGFLGTLASGAAASGLIFPTSAVEKTIEVVGDEATIDKLVSAKDGPILACEGNPDQYIAIHDLLSKSFYGATQGQLERMSDSEYLEWVHGHVEVNRRHRLLPGHSFHR